MERSLHSHIFTRTQGGRIDKLAQVLTDWIFIQIPCFRRAPLKKQRQHCLVLWCALGVAMHLVRSFTVLLLLLRVSRAEWFRHGAACSEQVFGCSPEGIATSFGSAASSVTQGNICITPRKGDCRTKGSYLISCRARICSRPWYTRYNWLLGFSGPSSCHMDHGVHSPRAWMGGQRPL